VGLSASQYANKVPHRLTGGHLYSTLSTDRFINVEVYQDPLDKAFMALADPIRRAIVARLSRSDATLNELAQPFAITKQAISKHIHVLEQAGLVTKSRDAQRKPVHLDPAALERLTSWIDQYRLIAERRYRALDQLLQHEALRTLTNPIQQEHTEP
jgi:DNA-binding transcriptional ArsR family regulator